MNAFHFAFCALPLSGYFATLAYMHLSRRIRIVDGGRDFFALGLAVLGLAAIGPLELFLPEPAAAFFGIYTRGMMATLYVLFLSLVILNLPPRIVAYNATRKDLRPLLEQALREFNVDVHWAGDSFFVPRFHLQGCMHEFTWLRTVTVLPQGPRAKNHEWQRLRRLMAKYCQQAAPHKSKVGLLFAALAILLSTSSLAYLASASQSANLALARYFMQAD